MNKWRLALYYGLQWTWALPVNLAGLILNLLAGRARRFRWYGAFVVSYGERSIFRQRGCFAVGQFIFMRDRISQPQYERLLVHEYGHTVQSIIFGPLFPLVIGLPSVLWSAWFWPREAAYAKRGVRYVSRFPENQANRLGERVTGRQATRR